MGDKWLPPGSGEWQDGVEPTEPSTRWEDFWGGAIVFVIVLTICLVVLAWVGVL